MKWIFPNMILIAGDGRNVGKTTFAISIIRHFSERTEVIGIKTSSHIHDINEDLDLIYKTSDFVVVEEKGRNTKDSSLLLKAGAKRVFFIMAKQEHLEQAFSAIAGKLDQALVVAESGGLIELIEPGIFFFVMNHKGQITKKHYLKHKPIIVANGDPGFDFDIDGLSYRNKRISVSQQEW